jgi:hypothetical protein
MVAGLAHLESGSAPLDHIGDEIEVALKRRGSLGWVFDRKEEPWPLVGDPEHDCVGLGQDERFAHPSPIDNSRNLPRRIERQIVGGAMGAMP